MGSFDDDPGVRPGGQRLAAAIARQLEEADDDERRTLLAASLGAIGACLLLG